MESKNSNLPIVTEKVTLEIGGIVCIKKFDMQFEKGTVFTGNNNILIGENNKGINCTNNVVICKK